MMEFNDRDAETLMICSVRYALGRMTYMPSMVQDIIRCKIHQLSENCLKVIIDSIETHGGLGWHNPAAYGDPYDYRGWMEFNTELKRELEKRKENHNGA